MAKRLKLNKVATAWLRALRSGDFKQTAGTLAEINKETGEIVGLCCMGVLCELAVKAKVISSPRVGTTDLYYDGENAILPDSVREWVGLKDPTGSFGKGVDQNNLTNSNDSGKSFKQIARIIEQKAKELFV